LALIRGLKIGKIEVIELINSLKHGGSQIIGLITNYYESIKKYAFKAPMYFDAYDGCFFLSDVVKEYSEAREQHA
jgi:hypothetical protein